jgi:hypothetical protein
LICDEKQSKAFESIEEYAKKYEEEKKQEKIDAPKIHKITKEYTKADDIWADINAIPAYEIACDIW